MSVQEIVLFRKKYPQYNDLDDMTLATKLAKKYPSSYGNLPNKIQIEQSKSKYNLVKQQGAGNLLQPTFEKVEEKIATRPKAWEAFREEVKQPWVKPRNTSESFRQGMRVPVTVLKGLNLVRERGEGSIANFLLKAQEGFSEKGEGWRNVVAAADVVKQGLTGERRGEFGDITRRMGLRGDKWYSPGELASAGIGFAVLTGITDYITKGKLLLETEKRLPRRMSGKARQKWLTQRAEMVGEGADDAVNTINSQYDAFYKSPAGKTTISPKYQKTITDTLDDFNKTINKDIGIKADTTDDLAGVLTEIETSLGNNLDATISNIHKIKTSISRFITPKTWSLGSKSKGNQYQLWKAWHKMKNIINDSLGTKDSTALGRMDTSARFIYQRAKYLKNLVADELGRSKEASRLVGEIKSKYRTGGKNIIDEFAKIEPRLKLVVTDIQKLLRRESIVGTIKRFTPWTIGGIYGLEKIKRATEKLGGQSTVQSGGQ